MKNNNVGFFICLATLFLSIIPSHVIKCDNNTFKMLIAQVIISFNCLFPKLFKKTYAFVSIISSFICMCVVVEYFKHIPYSFFNIICLFSTVLMFVWILCVNVGCFWKRFDNMLNLIKIPLLFDDEKEKEE